MKKSSKKKHTVTQSATPSIPNTTFPQSVFSNTEEFQKNYIPVTSSCIIDERKKTIENAKKVLEDAFGNRYKKIFNEELNSVVGNASWVTQSLNSTEIPLSNSSSVKPWTSDDFLGSNVLPKLNTNVDIPIGDTISNFKKCMANYPQYISVETATVLNIAVALENEVILNNLPDDDKKVITEQLDKQNNNDIIREKFTVKLDDTKDFELIFKVKSKLKIEEQDTTINEIDKMIDKMIGELEKECELKQNSNITIRLFNTVIHPKNPVSTFGVPISIDGELVTNQEEDSGVKIEDGTIKMDTAGRFKYLAGISKNKPTPKYVSSGSEPKKDGDQTIIKSSKNAYEIRLSVIECATDIIKLSNRAYNPEEAITYILKASKDLYKFIENKQ